MPYRQRHARQATTRYCHLPPTSDAMPSREHCPGTQALNSAREGRNAADTPAPHSISTRGSAHRVTLWATRSAAKWAAHSVTKTPSPGASPRARGRAGPRASPQASPGATQGAAQGATNPVDRRVTRSAIDWTTRSVTQGVPLPALARSDSGSRPRSLVGLAGRTGGMAADSCAPVLRAHSDSLVHHCLAPLAVEGAARRPKHCHPLCCASRLRGATRLAGPARGSSGPGRFAALVVFVFDSCVSSGPSPPLDFSGLSTYT
jgi:hypothetical protein